MQEKFVQFLEENLPVIEEKSYEIIEVLSLEDILGPGYDENGQWVQVSGIKESESFFFLPNNLIKDIPSASLEGKKVVITSQGDQEEPFQKITSLVKENV